MPPEYSIADKAIFLLFAVFTTAVGIGILFRPRVVLALFRWDRLFSEAYWADPRSTPALRAFGAAASVVGILMLALFAHLFL